MALQMDLQSKRSTQRLAITQLLHTAGNAPLRIYKGTKPATADLYNAATSAADLLATYAPADYSTTSTDSGVVALIVVGSTINTVPNATATGTATWFAVQHNVATDVVMIGTVGTSISEDLTLIDTTLVSGNPVVWGSFEFTVA